MHKMSDVAPTQQNNEIASQSSVASSVYIEFYCVGNVVRVRSAADDLRSSQCYVTYNDQNALEQFNEVCKVGHN